MKGLADDWAVKCADYLNNEMAKVDVPLYPHLGVISTPLDFSRDEEGGTFQWAPNRVKFSLELPKENFEATTSFEFFVRIKDQGPKLIDAIEDFAKVSISSHLEFNNGESKFLFSASRDGSEISIKTRMEETPKKKSETGEVIIFSEVFPQKDKKDGKENLREFQYRILLKKTVELKDEVAVVTIELKNLSDKRTYNKAKDHENRSKLYYYGPLCNVKGMEAFRKIVVNNGMILRYTNILPEVNVEKNSIFFSDRVRRIETIYNLKNGELLTIFGKKEGLSEELISVFSQDPINIRSLRKFQELAVVDINKALKDKSKNAVVITSRTAGGKTEAFLLPLLNYCIDKISLKGTKGIIFYPTKALANDQANRINRYLYYLNNSLSKQGKRNVTIGLYHGDIDETEVDWVPYKCPIKECNERLNYNKGVYSCKNHPQIKIEYILSTRNEIQSNPPDILITNPDTINRLLMLRPEAHSFLGRSVKFCPSCGATYAQLSKRHCDAAYCQKTKKSLEILKPESIPKFIIFDEIHLLRGGFGVHVSYFLSRLKNVLNQYASHLGEDYFPCLIGSTATIKNPEHFSSHFFNLNKTAVSIIPPRTMPESEIFENSDDKTIKRVHLFWMPQAYQPSATAGMAVRRAYEFFEQEQYIAKGILPRILIFVNSIKDANDLIGIVRSRIGSKLNVGGHNTDFDHTIRAQVEKEFNDGILNVLVATKTLEVGVDFDDIDILIVFGAPFSYNDYLQRIGRAGRKSNALILNIFKNYMPVDNYFFENNELLVSKEKRAEIIETVPLERDNEYILTKTVRAAIFDYMAARENASELFDDGWKFLDTLFYEGKIKPEEKQNLLLWMQNAIGSNNEENRTKQKTEKEIEEILIQTLKTLNSATSQIKTLKAPMKKVFQIVDSKYYLGNMRYADPAVQVVFH